MPLVYQQNINATTRLGLWHIQEDESFFLREVPLSRQITHPHKRLQHLAGRLLLKVLFPSFPLDLIKVADTRRPYLEDDAFHFSISHGGDYAAVLVSTRFRVGVDIEIPQEKISRLSGKFLGSKELAVISAWPLDEIQRLTLAWSVKESLFKWYGQSVIDFREHLLIEEASTEGHTFLASCRIQKHEPRHLVVRGQWQEGCILTHVLS